MIIAHYRYTCLVPPSVVANGWIVQNQHRLSLSETLCDWRAGANRVMLIPMVDVLILLWTALTSLFSSRVRLEAEILVLRQQINVLRRNSPKRSVFRPFDRLLFVGLYCLAPGILDALGHRPA